MEYFLVIIISNYDLIYKHDLSLSPNDRQIILSNGLGVVDCSWNQLEKVSLPRIKVIMYYSNFILFVNKLKF